MLCLGLRADDARGVAGTSLGPVVEVGTGAGAADEVGAGALGVAD